MKLMMIIYCPSREGASGIDWDSVISRLKAINYSGDLNLEVNNSFKVLPGELLFDTMQYGVKILPRLKAMFT